MQTTNETATETNDGLTWVFTGGIVVEAHRPTCSAIRPNARKGRVVVTDEESKADLLERQYEVKRCGCAK